VTRPVSYVASSYLQAESRVVGVSVIEVVKVALLFTLMVLLAPYGIMALCGAVGSAFAFQALALLWAVTRDGLPFWATLLRIARPLLATVPMAGAVLAARFALASAGLRSAVISVAIEIVVGAVVYVGSAFLIAGDTARDLLSLARSRRRSRGEEAAAA
jgi:hypothetical protein